MGQAKVKSTVHTIGFIDMTCMLLLDTRVLSTRLYSAAPVVTIPYDFGMSHCAFKQRMTCFTAPVCFTKTNLQYEYNVSRVILHACDSCIFQRFAGT